MRFSQSQLSWVDQVPFEARSYPAARIESHTGLRGARAWMVVPQFGCELIESVPFTSFSRSSMLMRPRPRLSFDVSRSKPAPESLTVR